MLRSLGFTTLDLVALGWFFVWWIGYARFAEWRARREPSLLSVMLKYRRDWWVRIIERELRMIDTSIIANLSNSATFFASTTLLILGGLLALLGTTEQVSAVVRGLPFSKGVSETGWELKILLLVGIFVYAFFKFTWSMRQFNYTALLIGATPPADDPDCVTAARRAARMGDLAVKHFNDGIRAYYFGLAGLTWFIHPWVFVLASSWIVLVLWRREFRSNTLSALRD
jgi:uncharacterized membrane protein